jgi:hypothetical protein
VLSEALRLAVQNFDGTMRFTHSQYVKVESNVAFVEHDAQAFH